MSSASEPSPLQSAETGRPAPPTGLKRLLARGVAFFDRPLTLASRVLILTAVLSAVPAFLFPLWNMTFTSNQYTDGLTLHIYAYKLEGGKTPNRDDLREINSLNHYIGMRPLLESDFSEFAWLPFVIGALMLLSLRAMVIGRMSNLVDVFVIFTYFGLFSFWSFYNRLYTYGHHLDLRRRRSRCRLSPRRFSGPSRSPTSRSAAIPTSPRFR
jgi:hypothetical protein